MTDRPADVVDRDNDRPTDQQSHVGARPTDHAGLSLEQAADQLGISVNAVRQRIKRGTLSAERGVDGWVVFLATDPVAGRRPTDRPTTTARATSNQPPDQDAIAPLVDLVADLSRQNAELSAAAALWQERARFLGERLAALEAGEIRGDSARNSVESEKYAQDANSAPVSDEGFSRSDLTLGRDSEAPRPDAASQATGWRAWWRRITGG